MCFLSKQLDTDLWDRTGPEQHAWMAGRAAVDVSGTSKVTPQRRDSSGRPLLPPYLHPCEHLTLCLEPLVRVVLKHLLGEVAGHGLRSRAGAHGLEEVRDDSVAHVVEPEAGQAGRVPQRPPGAIPLLCRLGRVVVVVLARAPKIMLRVGVAEFVRAFEHPWRGPQFSRTFLVCNTAEPAYSERVRVDPTGLRKRCLGTHRALLTKMRGVGARFVYILRSESNPDRHYVGRTADVDTRLAWHNDGPCGYTRNHRPWSVIVSVEFPDESRATRFERYLKSGSGRAFAKRHFWNRPLLTDLLPGNTTSGYIWKETSRRVPRDRTTPRDGQKDNRKHTADRYAAAGDLEATPREYKIPARGDSAEGARRVSAHRRE